MRPPPGRLRLGQPAGVLSCWTEAEKGAAGYRADCLAGWAYWMEPVAVAVAVEAVAPPDVSGGVQ